MRKILDAAKAVLFLIVVTVLVCTMAWLPKKVEDMEGDRSGSDS